MPYQGLCRRSSVTNSNQIFSPDTLKGTYTLNRHIFHEENGLEFSSFNSAHTTVLQSDMVLRFTLTYRKNPQNDA